MGSWRCVCMCVHIPVFMGVGHVGAAGRARCVARFPQYHGAYHILLYISCCQLPTSAKGHARLQDDVDGTRLLVQRWRVPLWDDVHALAEAQGHV